MIVEWIGGEKDGGQFETPDDCRFIELIRTPVVHWPDDGTPLEELWPVDVEKGRFDIVTGHNGKHYVYWSEKWS